jgi:PhnB protein
MTNTHPVAPYLTVEDAAAAIEFYTLTRNVADQFWGDRFGEVQDPFGHSWLISTHVEDLTPEEIAERANAAKST